MNHEPVELREQICGSIRAFTSRQQRFNFPKPHSYQYLNNLPFSVFVAPDFHWDPIHNHTMSGMWEMRILLDGRAGPHAPIFEQYQAKAEHFLCAALQKNKGPQMQLHTRSISFEIAVMGTHISLHTLARRAIQKTVVVLTGSRSGV